jgi:hypothetical protein
MILFSQGKAAGQECGESQCEEGSGGADGTGRARCTAVLYFVNNQAVNGSQKS